MSAYCYAKVGEDKLRAIRVLEDELGKPVVALQPVGLQPASLDKAELDKLKAAERRLGVMLLAVKP